MRLNIGQTSLSIKFQQDNHKFKEWGETTPPPQGVWSHEPITSS